MGNLKDARDVIIISYKQGRGGKKMKWATEGVGLFFGFFFLKKGNVTSYNKIKLYNTFPWNVLKAKIKKYQSNN